MSDDDKQDETSGRQRSDETEQNTDEREREHTPLPGPRAVSREFSQGTGFMRVGTDEHMPTELGDEPSETRGWTRRDENEPNEEKQMNIQEHEAVNGMIPISDNDLVEVVEAGIEQREQEEFTQQQEVAVSDENEYEEADATEKWEQVNQRTRREFNIQGMENMDQPAPEGVVDSHPKPPPFRQPTESQLATTPSEVENMFSAENVEVSEDISEPVAESDQDDVPEIPADAIQAADDENDEPEETPAQQENPPIVGESTTEPTETGDGNGGNGGGGSSSGGGSGGSGNTRQTGPNRAAILAVILVIAALLFGTYDFFFGTDDDSDTPTQVAQKSESNVKVVDKPDDKEVVEEEPEEETDEIAFGDDEVADVPSSEETDDTEDETEVKKLTCKYVAAEDDPGAPRTIEGWFVIECDGQMKKGKPVFNDRGKVVRLDPIKPCAEEECKQLHL